MKIFHVKQHDGCVTNIPGTDCFEEKGVWTVWDGEERVAMFTNVSVVTIETKLEADRLVPATAPAPESWKTPIEALPTGRIDSEPVEICKYCKKAWCTCHPTPGDLRDE